MFGNDYPTPDGTGVRDYLHVCDLCAATSPPCALPAAGGELTVNLGTGRGHSVLDVVRAFETASVNDRCRYASIPAASGVACCWNGRTPAAPNS